MQDIHAYSISLNELFRDDLSLMLLRILPIVPESRFITTELLNNDLNKRELLMDDRINSLTGIYLIISFKTFQPLSWCCPLRCF